MATPISVTSWRTNSWAARWTPSGSSPHGSPSSRGSAPGWATTSSTQRLLLNVGFRSANVMQVAKNYHADVLVFQFYRLKLEEKEIMSDEENILDSMLQSESERLSKSKLQFRKWSLFVQIKIYCSDSMAGLSIISSEEKDKR